MCLVYNTVSKPLLVHFIIEMTKVLTIYLVMRVLYFKQCSDECFSSCRSVKAVSSYLRL